MNLAWRATLITVTASVALVLVACTSGPSASPSPGSSVPAGSASPATPTTPAGSPDTPSPSPSPSAPPGPTLTKAQFADLIATGKVGNRDVSLAPRSLNGAGDPDGEDAEGEKQSAATSCVKMYKLADAALVAQASDDDQGAVIQIFKSAATAAELFALNRECASEQAKYSPGTAWTSVADGSVGSALWWLSKDPDLNYQMTVSYGNAMAFVLVEADTDSSALTRAFVAQVDEAAKG